MLLRQCFTEITSELVSRLFVCIFRVLRAGEFTVSMTASLWASMAFLLVISIAEDTIYQIGKQSCNDVILC